MTELSATILKPILEIDKDYVAQNNKPVYGEQNSIWI